MEMPRPLYSCKSAWKEQHCEVVKSLGFESGYGACQLPRALRCPARKMGSRRSLPLGLGEMK